MDRGWARSRPKLYAMSRTCTERHASEINLLQQFSGNIGERLIALTAYQLHAVYGMELKRKRSLNAAKNPWMLSHRIQLRKCEICIGKGTHLVLHKYETLLVDPKQLEQFPYILRVAGAIWRWCTNRDLSPSVHFVKTSNQNTAGEEKGLGPLRNSDVRGALRQPRNVDGLF